MKKFFFNFQNEAKEFSIAIKILNILINDDSSDDGGTDEEININFKNNDGQLEQLRNFDVDPIVENKQVDFPNLKKLLNDPDLNEVILTPVIVHKKEILLAIIKYIIIHSLSLSGFSDLTCMIYSFFQTKIIPDSLYLLDKSFTSKTGVDYHAVCIFC